MFRSQALYAVDHAIPYSTFLGRTVEPGEPLWLPEDRDIVVVVNEYLRSRHECGRWDWEYEDFQEFTLDFSVCPFCRDVGEYAEVVREKRKHMYGVSYSYYSEQDAADH